MATQTKGSSSEHSQQPSNDAGGVVAFPDAVAVRAYDFSKYVAASPVATATPGCALNKNYTAHAGHSNPG